MNRLIKRNNLGDTGFVLITRRNQRKIRHTSHYQRRNRSSIFIIRCDMLNNLINPIYSIGLDV